MRMMTAAAMLMATSATAEPVCHAAADRLARQIVVAMGADEGDVDLTAITRRAGDALAPAQCALLLSLPDSSITALARAFVDDDRLRREGQPSE